MKTDVIIQIKGENDTWFAVALLFPITTKWEVEREPTITSRIISLVVSTTTIRFCSAPFPSRTCHVKFEWSGSSTG